MAAPSNTKKFAAAKRTLVDVKKSNEQWSEYNLADGSVILIRPVVLDVSRIEGQFNDDGSQIYEVTGTSVMKVRKPKSVKSAK